MCIYTGINIALWGYYRNTALLEGELVKLQSSHVVTCGVKEKRVYGILLKLEGPTKYSHQWKVTKE